MDEVYTVRILCRVLSVHVFLPIISVLHITVCDHLGTMSRDIGRWLDMLLLPGCQLWNCCAKFFKVCQNHPHFYWSSLWRRHGLLGTHACIAWNLERRCQWCMLSSKQLMVCFYSFQGSEVSEVLLSSHIASVTIESGLFELFGTRVMMYCDLAMQYRWVEHVWMND